MHLTIFDLSFEVRDAINDIVDAQNQENSLELIKEIMATKADQVFAYNEEIEAYTAVLNGKINDLNDRVAMLTKRKKALDELVLSFLDVTGRKEINSGAARIAAKKPMQVVEIYDEKLIPIEFIKIPEPKPTIMKAEIKEKLKMGEIIDGARLVDGKKSVMYKLL